MGTIFGCVMLGLLLFVGLRFLVNWLSSKPGPEIVVKPQPKQFRRGKIVR